MKIKLAILLCLAGLPAFGQLVLINVGTNADTGSGEMIGRNTWIHLNNNSLLVQSLANAANSNAMADVPTGRLPLNSVYTSGTRLLLDTNPFVFSSSNFIGNFTNPWAVTEPVGAGPYTNMMSVDGGSTWTRFYASNVFVQVTVTNIGTNYVYTNAIAFTNYYTNTVYGPVQLAVLSGAASTGAVQVATLTNPELNGRANQFVGQTFDFTSAYVTGVPITVNYGIIAHSTDSTYPYGAGLISFGMDNTTNYLYVSVGTNNWGRLEIKTNAW